MIDRVPEIRPAVTWTKSLFPPASLGAEIFPSTLEGRVRHRNNADLPLDLFIPRRYLPDLDKRGVLTILDVLKDEKAKFNGLINRRSDRLDFNERIFGYWMSQIAGPEGLLLRAVFARDVFFNPIPVRFEEQRRGAVYGAVSTLRVPWGKIVLDLRYGLSMGFAESDGLPKSLPQVARVINRTDGRVRQIQAKALTVLRHPSRSEGLRPFLPLDLETVGREVFDISAGCEFVEKYPLGSKLRLDELECYDQVKGPISKVISPWFVGTDVKELLNVGVNCLPAEAVEKIKQEIEQIS